MNDPTWIPRLQGLLGMVVILGAAYACSCDRARVSKRLVLVGMISIIVSAGLIQKVPPFTAGLEKVSDGVRQVIQYSNRGGEMVWGELFKHEYTLKLHLPPVASQAEGISLPEERISLLIIARFSGGGYHYRIFDRNGKMSVDKSHTDLEADQQKNLKELIDDRLPDFSDESKFDESNLRDKERLAISERAASILGHNTKAPWGFVFVTKVPPIIIFASSLMAILYHYGVMQFVIKYFGLFFRKLFGRGITNTEAIVAAANVFIGHTEAPLCVRPHIATMTRSQLMAVMTCGFATVSCTMIGAYYNLLNSGLDENKTEFMDHLLLASFLSAPAALVIAKIIEPETNPPQHDTDVMSDDEVETANLIDAAAHGATRGMKIVLNIVAMLIGFSALVALINGITIIIHPSITIEALLGWLMIPVAYLIGVEWEQCRNVAELIGQQMVLTEFVGFKKAGPLIPLMDDRTQILVIYALCGFASIPSIGVQVGGLIAIAPERARDFSRLALRAMLAGSAASWLTACVIGFFI